MNPARMRARGLHFTDAEPAILPGFRLVFNKQSHCRPSVAYANVEQASHGEVEGVLYTLAGVDDLLLMDQFEGTPVRYSRDIFSVMTASGSRSTWIYVANPAFLNHNLLPESGYLAHLLAGREFLSAKYLDILSSQEYVVSEPIHGKDGLLRNA